MEYYILKLYQKEIKKCSDGRLGLKKYEPKIKKFVIIYFIIIVAAAIEMIFTIALFPNKFWYGIGVIVMGGAVIVFFKLENKNQENHMDKYMDLHKKKLRTLEKILKKDFNIKSRKKIEGLISIYQEWINKEKKKKKKRNRIIISLFSTVAGFLTISFQNMGIIGISFLNWLYLASFILLFTTMTVICIYSSNICITLKKSYEMMIKDLKELLLLKY